MPLYKKQHWLPSAYLQFFSKDSNEISRESWFYPLHDGSFVMVKVETQGADNYHYSKSQPEDIESAFQKRESRYPELIRKIINHEPLTSNEKFNMCFILLSWHFRNSAYKNSSSHENGIMFQNIFLGFMKNTANVGAYNDINDLEHKIKIWVKNNLVFEVVRVPDSESEVLLTSDHPFVLLCNQSHSFLFSVVPLTVRHWEG